MMPVSRPSGQCRKLPGPTKADQSPIPSFGDELDFLDSTRSSLEHEVWRFQYQVIMEPTTDVLLDLSLKYGEQLTGNTAQKTKTEQGL